MIHFVRTVLGPLGFGHGENIEQEFMNETGATLAIGEIAAVDLGSLEAETTSFVPGGVASAWAVLTAVSALNNLDGTAPFVMALESIADGVQGKCLIYGTHPGITILDGGADNNCLISDKLIAVAAQQELDCNQAATGRILGRPQTHATLDVSSVVVPIFFNGVDFLGIT